MMRSLILSVPCWHYAVVSTSDGDADICHAVTADVATAADATSTSWYKLWADCPVVRRSLGVHCRADNDIVRGDQGCCQVKSICSPGPAALRSSTFPNYISPSASLGAHPPCCSSPPSRFSFISSISSRCLPSEGSFPSNSTRLQ